MDHHSAVLVDRLQKYSIQDDNQLYQHFVDVDDADVRTAEEMAASLYGADNTYFLTNGSTQGIHGLIMAACRANDKILVPRNAHRSVLGALVLSGAKPVFIEPVYSQKRGFPLHIRVEDVQEALQIHPDCCALFLVHPTYQGIISDVRSIAHRCHEHGIPVLVDEAHGPHLGFHQELPQSALQCGADGVVQSTHKWIGALTQSSMVHRQGSLLEKSRFDASFELLREKRSSLMLLASLDGARRQMALEGEALLGRTIQMAERMRQAIFNIDGISTFDRMDVQKDGSFDFDPTKLCIDVSGLGITGRDADCFLRESCGIQAEMADMNNILFLLTIADSQVEEIALVDALKELSRKKRGSNQTKANMGVLPGLRETLMPVKEAFHSQSRKVPLIHAVGAISHAVVCPYPPGIPVVYPGEKLTADVVEYILKVYQSGIPVLGLEDHHGDPYVTVVSKS